MSSCYSSPKESPLTLNLNMARLRKIICLPRVHTHIAHIQQHIIILGQNYYDLQLMDHNQGSKMMSHKILDWWSFWLWLYVLLPLNSIAVDLARPTLPTWNISKRKPTENNDSYNNAESNWSSLTQYLPSGLSTKFELV